MKHGPIALLDSTMPVVCVATEVAAEDLPTLQKELRGAIETALDRFEGIDRSRADFEALLAAQERLAAAENRDAFAREFLLAQALFEFLEPDHGLTREERADYRWLAKIYQSVQPATTSDALLWQRLGAKTHALIVEHIGDIEIGKGGPTTIVLDEASIEQLRLLGLEDLVDGGEMTVARPPTAAEVIDSIQSRLDARLRGYPSSPVYRSLAERLDSLRQTVIESAEDSVRFLQRLLEVARALVQAEREQIADEGAIAVTADGAAEAAESLLPDQRIGALTQIFREYAPDERPEIIERVVLEIDSVVVTVRFSGWQASREGDRLVKFEIRRSLKKFGLDPTGSSSIARTRTSRSTTDAAAVRRHLPRRCRARARAGDEQSRAEGGLHRGRQAAATRPEADPSTHEEATGRAGSLRASASGWPLTRETDLRSYRGGGVCDPHFRYGDGQG